MKKVILVTLGSLAVIFSGVLIFMMILASYMGQDDSRTYEYWDE